MISGQAPNPKTSADCAQRVAFAPSGTKLTIDRNGQAVGQGCVYPSEVKTLADQLSAAGAVPDRLIEHGGGGERVRGSGEGVRQGDPARQP